MRQGARARTFVTGLLCTQKKLQPKLAAHARSDYNPPVHLLFPLLSSLLYVSAAMFIKQAASGGVGAWRTSFVCNWITALLFLALLPLGGAIPPVVQFYQPAVVALLFVAGQLFTFLALDKGDVSVATPVMGVKVVLVAAFSLLFKGETVRWELWAAATLSCVGIGFLNRSADDKAVHHDVIRTIILALLAAACYASFDVLVTKWSPEWGMGRFLPVMLFMAAGLSFVFVPLFREPLKTIPKKALRPLLLGSLLMGLQAIVLISALAKFNDATAINVIYSTRGLWSVIMVWAIGHWFANQEQQLGKKILQGRLIGAGFLCAAVALVFV